MVELMASFRSSGMIDPGWEHGFAQDERKKRVKCNYCGKVVSGGIYRLKQHLARVSGEVTYCDKAPEEVYIRMKENLEGSRSFKKLKQSEDDAQGYLNMQYENEEEHLGYRRKGKQFIGDRNMIANMTPVRSSGYVDPGWEYGVAQDERKKKVKCNFCEKVVSGGINRFKQHLARIPGEVAPCKNAPEEVYSRMKENMKWHRTGRRQRQLDGMEICFYGKQPNDEHIESEQDQGSPLCMKKERLVVGSRVSEKGTRLTFKGMSSISGSEPSFKRSRLDSFILNSSNGQISPSFKKMKVKSRSSRKSRKDVVSSICKFFYHAGVPLQAANSLYFHKMLELVVQHGHDLTGLEGQLMSCHHLQEEIATVKSYLIEYKASWATTGCSIMANTWTDIEGRRLINLLVSSPHGAFFIARVNAIDMVQDASSLFKLLDKVVDEMGEENVVQVITDNTPHYRAAGKMLEEKRKNLFWTPCATYCMDQMLEEFMRIKCIEECMLKGQKITKLIHKSIWLQNLMKEFSDGQELLRPSSTRCASSFATLQSLLDHRTSLRRLFQSSKWISSRFSKLMEGKEAEKIVLNAAFWKKVQYVCRSVEPVMHIIQKVFSGDTLSMPYIYNDMYKAKLAIKFIHGENVRKYGPFCNAIDNHWNSLLRHPLIMAAYFLNPLYRYNPEFMASPEVFHGLKECIARLEPDSTRRASASRQISDYNSAKGDFGTELAISTRTELDPAAWWQQHGISCMELQRVAVRVLSQTCTSVVFDRAWSVYDQVHFEKQNRLAQKRLDDLIFVHYNLRLRECQLNKRSNSVLSLDSALMEHLLDDWVSADRNSVEEDEEMVYNGEGTTYEIGYENDLMEYLDDTMEAQKGSVEILTVNDVDTVAVDTNPTNAGVSTDNDDEQNFFIDDLSD